MYILHRVWVSIHPHIHTLDAFASAALHLTAPCGGFAEQSGQEAAQSEPSSSWSLLAVGAGGCGCHSHSVEHRGTSGLCPHVRSSR